MDGLRLRLFKGKGNKLDGPVKGSVVQNVCAFKQHCDAARVVIRSGASRCGIVMSPQEDPRLVALAAVSLWQ